MASRIASRYFTTVLRPPRTISPSFMRPYPRLPRTLQPFAPRFAHAIPRPTRTKQDEQTTTEPAAPRKELEPHYQLTFTCVPCTNRSTHIISKQGYHRGSVLITCPSCRNRHVISDNLNIFGDRKITVEDLLREKGQLVKRGTLGEDGDIEFWEDAAAAAPAADPPRAGGESAVSEGGEGDSDRAEAETLRETRDPSSQTTDPTPSASLLPGDTGTRPSVQGLSHRTTTPSTRRQYSTTEFEPPTLLTVRDRIPLAKFGPSYDTFFPKRSKPLGLPSYNRPIRPPPLGKPTQKPTISPREAQSKTVVEQESNLTIPLKMRTDLEPWQRKLMEKSRRKEKKERESEIADMLLKRPSKSKKSKRSLVRKFLRRPIRSTYEPPIRRVLPREREVMAEPEFRRAYFEPEFKKFRFIESKGDAEQKGVQLRPGVVSYRRPLGGEVSEKPVVSGPKSWRSLTQQYGYFHPQGVSPSSPQR
ncbi:DNL zinc finger-domain-containing protein [Xylaria venustula]|nr:DNL zinc finger-domain-containing protein [Xylaria venustula]